MRLAAVTAVAAGMLAAAGLAPAAHAAGASLTPTGKAKFPHRSYVLTLPAGTTPSPGQFRVRENGSGVSDLTVRPAGGRFGVVLVIDTSKSMHGEAIEGAMAAARAFASQRPATQALGVVTFNGTARVLVPPTKDAPTIDAALARTPLLGAGTHIHDATSMALAQLKRSRFDAGAVVVLSDGADSGSTTSAQQVAAAARSAHARVFAVGLRSRSFDPQTLEGLASVGAGEYLGAASGTALADLYRRLGAQLANAYFVRYRSLAQSGARVTASVDVAGLHAADSYAAPKLDLEAATAEAAPAQEPGFLATTAGAAAVAGAVLILAFFAVLTLVSGGRRREAMRRRITAYGLPTAPEPAPDEEPRRARPSLVAAAAGRALGEGRWERLAESLELARIELTPGRFVTAVAGATLTVAWLATLLAGSAFAALLMFLLVPFGARVYVRSRIAGQRREFADQLADSMEAVASAMRTGNSFAGALAILVEDAPEPTATEFRRVIADERLGVSLEDAFGDVVRRMDNRDLEQVALVSVVQRETGGNGAEALDRVVSNLRARADIRRLVRTLTSQGRMAQWVLTALPVVTVVAMTLIGGEQMKALHTTLIGQMALAISALLVVGGGVWIRKIVDIRV